MNHLGAGQYRGYSAGSQPLPQPNPLAVATLQRHGCEVAELRSKSWDEFALPDAPRMEFVFTVCDNAAGEACPLWPGGPVSAHWGIADPASVEGSEAARREAFELAFQEMHARISRFLALPFATLTTEELARHLVEIGTNTRA